MRINEILDEIERAYPEDIFRPLSKDEIDLIHSKYPGFIDRASAAMGRHLLKVIRRKLEEPEERGEEKTASDQALDDICILIDAPEWEYPGQVVRDVARSLGMDLDTMAAKLRKERE